MPDVRFDPLSSNRPLIVYIDYKSPYAFIATEPTYRLEEEFGIEIDWRPLTLDIPSFLGSARLDADGVVTDDRRSETQWSAVRHAYRDARRYAVAAGKTLRGTTKIWDTSLAHIGMLWAKRHGRDVLRRYTTEVYPPFWRRELDLESLPSIEALLRAAGAPAAGFGQWAANDGRAEHDAMQRAVFDAGIFGVPTYVIDGEVYFGREHLPVVRWHLGGSRGTPPDIAYERGGVAREWPRVGPEKRLTIAIDPANPHAWLGFAPTCAFVDATGVTADWVPCLPTPERSGGARGTDRGGRHRAMSSDYRRRDRQRAASRSGLAIADPERADDSTLASLAFLFARESAPGRARGVIEHLLNARFRDGVDLASPGLVGDALTQAGVPLDAFDAFCNGRGPAELEATQTRLRSLGATGTPTYLLDDEPFHGREHLPMLGWLLADRQGPPPI